MTTKGTDNRFRSLTVVGESGTPATPASGDFKLYVADDGTFYLMDDTGTPTAVGGGFSDPMTTRGDIIVRNSSNVTARLAIGSSGKVLSSDGTDVSWQTPAAAGISSGTSFPGSPSTNDLYFRTDRGLVYFYNGTRWLTIQLYEHFLGQTAGITANQTDLVTAVWNGTYDLWLENAYGMLYTASGLSGSAYWQNDIYSAGTNPATPTTLAQMTNVSGTNGNYARKTAAIGALLGTGQHTFTMNYIKVSTPGPLIASAMLTYRLVG